MAYVWISIRSLNSVRANHTATRLPNGQVLVVGGILVPDFTGAELYNPATGIWSPITSIYNDGLSGHSATPLVNGQVLVVGGQVNGIAQKTTGLYDPTTETWTSVENLSAPRFGHTATRLPNGKVLVVGGWTNVDETALKTTELYDPNTRTWTLVENLQVARGGHTATQLSNGNILVAGGWSTPDSMNTAEIYDSATGKWTLTDNLKTPRHEHTATLLFNGQVLVVGGCSGGYLDIAENGAELYNPATGKWTLTDSLRTPRYAHTATLLTTASGTVMVVGGFSQYNNQGQLSSVELYNAVQGTWSPGEPLNNPRGRHTATVMSNGWIMVTGGYAQDSHGPESPGHLASCEVFLFIEDSQQKPLAVVPLIQGGSVTKIEFIKLQKYYDRIWLIAPPHEQPGQEAYWRHGAPIVIQDMKDFLRKHLAFMSQTKILEDLQMVSGESTNVILAAECFSLAQIAQSAGLVSEAAELYQQSSDRYAKAGQPDKKAEMLRALLGLYRKNGLSKEALKVEKVLDKLKKIPIP
jgi:N-acetylneuraminic acid mutarotase